MGLVKGEKRTKAQLAKDVLAGSLEMIVGAGLGGLVLSYAPKAHQASDGPGLYSLATAAGTSASLYMIMDGWYKIKNVHFVPEHPEEYHPVKELYANVAQFSRTPQPPAPAYAALETLAA